MGGRGGVGALALEWHVSELWKTFLPPAPNICSGIFAGTPLSWALFLTWIIFSKASLRRSSSKNADVRGDDYVGINLKLYHGIHYAKINDVRNNMLEKFATYQGSIFFCFHNLSFLFFSTIPPYHLHRMQGIRFVSWLLLDAIGITLLQAIYDFNECFEFTRDGLDIFVCEADL